MLLQDIFFSYIVIVARSDVVVLHVSLDFGSYLFTSVVNIAQKDCYIPRLHHYFHRPGNIFIVFLSFNPYIPPHFLYLFIAVRYSQFLW